MNREELDILKELSEQTYFGDLPFLYYADLIGKLLTAYEKEKEERERIGKLYYEANENCIKYEKMIKKEKEKNKTLEELLQGRLFELYKYYKDLASEYQGNCVSKDKIKPIQIIDLDGKIHNVYKIEEE